MRPGCFSGAFLLLSWTSTLAGQTPPPAASYDEMTLEQILNTKIEIAARTEQTPEEAPSVVSVVTRRDIEAYGARDLADVLRRVAGFELGIDVESLVGMSFRGIWVHEGKALVMIDGQTVNDPGYGNVNYIGSYPASMIERVEIIRGPGSALYGGFAEVAVVNVITSKGSELNGGRVSVRGGALGAGEWMQSGNISVGASMPNGISFDLHAGFGKQPLSGRTYEDFFGGVLPMGSENSYREWNHVIAEASVRDLRFQFLHTDMKFLGQDVFGEIAQPLPNGLRTEKHEGAEDAFRLGYSARVSDSLTLHPLLEYVKASPLDRPVLPNEVFAGNMGVDTSTARYRAEVTGELALAGGGRLTAGLGYLRDSIHDVNDSGEPGLFGSHLPGDFVADRVNESRYALAQLIQPFGPVGVTVGARYESTTSGSALAPRAGVTYVSGPFNAKLLYGRAYRIPTPFQQYSRDFGGLDLEPETASTVEAEVGYRLSGNVSARVNAFTVSVDKPITYGGGNSYVNLGFIRSNGFESEVNVRFARYGAFLNLAYAKPARNTSAGFLSEDGSRFLGTQLLKVNLGGYVSLGPATISPAITYLSPRSGQSQASAVSGETLESVDYPSRVLVNVNVSAKELLWGLDLALGIYNLFDTPYELIQPYYGGHSPMPAMDREVSLTIGRSF